MKRFEECVAYFSQKGFARILTEIGGKYRSLGRFGGWVEIEDPTDEERDTLFRYLARYFDDKALLRINIREFADRISDTKFEGIDLIEILEKVLKTRMTTNKMLEAAENAQRKELFDALYAEFEKLSVKAFIDDMVSNPVNYKSVYSRMSNMKHLREDLVYVCKALSFLPEVKRLRLPVFAAAVTGDPHAFDYEKEAGKLLLKALAYLSKQPYPESAEEKAALLYNSGLLINELSNFVMLNGLAAEGEFGENPIWKAAMQSRQPLIVSLYNLNEIERVKSAFPYAIAVENPAVFSSLIEADPTIPCVCINGQPNLAVLIVLEKLEHSGCILYYSGDLDPEGVVIADNLRKKFGNVRFFCMTGSHYQKVLSSRKLDGKRLSKLKKVAHPDLQDLCNVMREYKAAGYQENLLKDILEFVKQLKK